MNDLPSLEVAGLAYAYPDGHQALYGVDLAIARGERVALLGPNGAGKTTLVLHLNGILCGGPGIVRVAGLQVRPDMGREELREVRRRVGIVFQDPPTTSSSSPPCARTSPSARPTSASAAPRSRRG